jgi:putative ABC transport system substrate-binding protein
LQELGWTRGKNITVEERWANGDLGRMPRLIAEVIARNVDVIVTGTDSGALAARKTTSTIPIVAVALGDPVSTGVVDSLARPGGNLTGLSLQTGEGVPGKCLELIRETLPGLSTIAVLWNPTFPTARVQVRQLEKDAATHGVKLQLIAYDSSWQGLQAAFQQARAQAKAAIFFSDPLAYSDRRRVTALAAQSRLPVIYTVLDFVNDGGLMGYGGDFRVMYRRAAEYVDKVLRGAKPGDLPIEQANELKLALNLKTAQALGVTIPESILLRAEDVSR